MPHSLFRWICFCFFISGFSLQAQWKKEKVWYTQLKEYRKEHFGLEVGAGMMYRYRSGAHFCLFDPFRGCPVEYTHHDFGFSSGLDIKFLHYQNFTVSVHNLYGYYSNTRLYDQPDLNHPNYSHYVKESENQIHFWNTTLRLDYKIWKFISLTPGVNLFEFTNASTHFDKWDGERVSYENSKHYNKLSFSYEFGIGIYLTKKIVFRGLYNSGYSFYSFHACYRFL